MKVFLISTVIFILLSFAILATTFVFRTREKPSPIDGIITIQKMLCEQSADGTVTFTLKALNTVNQPLKNLNLGLNVANGDNIRQKNINMRLVEEGEEIEVVESIVFNDDVNACFVKFTENNQEIKANFRPTSGGN